MRRPSDRIHYIGKESNRLEDVEAGTVHRLSDVLSEYHDPDQDPFDLYIRPVMAEIPARVLAGAARTHARKVIAVRNGQSRAREVNRIAYTRRCGKYARERLRAVNIKPPGDDVAACRIYLATRQNPLMDSS